MTPPLPIPLDLGERAVAERVLQIQRAAYRVEAELIGFDGIPQLHESIDELQAADETWHGIIIDDIVAGAVSHRLIDGIVDIHRLVVDPAFFRRGVARGLIEHLHTTLDADTFIVSTGASNTPARTLYEGFGYVLDRLEEVVPGLTIACYRRTVTTG